MNKPKDLIYKIPEDNLSPVFLVHLNDIQDDKIKQELANLEDSAREQVLNDSIGVGTDAANQITSGIIQILNKNQNPVLSQLTENIRDDLSGHIFETVCYDPLTLVVAHAVKKQILTCRTPRYIPSDMMEYNKLDNLKHGDVIINTAPVKIVRYENPLNNQIKYKIDFETPIGHSFTISPSTVEDMIKELRMRGVVYKPRVVEEAINAVLNGAQRNNKVSVYDR